MSALQINLGPLKEPLGFIKILQWIFSIFAFATCGGYSGKTGLSLTCPGNQSVTLVADFSYPFRMNRVLLESLDKKKCNVSWPDKVVLLGDFSSSAQFYVTFAVLVFLYCMAALVLYVGYLHLYRGASKLPMIDFAVTVVVAFLWLVSTSAWAKALTDIKTSTGSSLIDGIDDCVKTPKLCHFDDDVRRMGSLNVSVVIGFLNLILWAGNAWFVYKETSLHQPPPTTPPNPAGPAVPSGM